MAARVTAARMAAFRVLLALERSRNTHCDELLRAPAVESLSAPDRNLTTALVMGVLRWQLALDAIVARYVQRGGALDPEIAIALRLGAFQLLAMDRIPAHAALAESVELAKVSGRPSASGMVNAILRRISETAGTIVLDPLAAHPAWMIARWERDFGQEATAAIAAYDQQPPISALRIADRASQIEGLASGEFLTRARRAPAGLSPEMMASGVRVQDEGSQLVAEIAGTGTRILDCCAAPGGKTAILAENNPQAEITACDVSESRLAAMRRTLSADARTRAVACVLADAMELPFRDDFDLILCDVPCSGTGTLARNPEIRLRLAAPDLKRQQKRQVAILRSAFRLLAPGGVLVYSTCSLEPEENAFVIDAFRADEPDAQLLEIEQRISIMERDGVLLPAGAQRLRASAVRDRYLQILPGVLSCDGFFTALLSRSTVRA